jgi:hypothetical protein
MTANEEKEEKGVLFCGDGPLFDIFKKKKAGFKKLKLYWLGTSQ